MVFGRRAGIDGGGSSLELPPAEPLTQRPEGAVAIDEVRSLADRFLGVIRTGSELEAVAAKLQASGGPSDEWGDRSATLVATLLADAALRRRESRGGHYRSDFPHTLPEWRFRQAVSSRGWARVPVPA
jgi:L-aspartate oxidase